MRRLLVALVAVLVAGCGGGSGNGGREHVDLMLDFFPNADHAPIYAAQARGEFKRRGLDVRIRTPADLHGKTVGTAGIDYQSAYLHAIAPPGVKQVNVGFDLVPALVSGKVDAVLGAYWNYEAIQLRQKGRNPRVIRIDRAGVPTYDELVVTAKERDVLEHPDRIRRFLAGLEAGARVLRADPEIGVRPLLAANRTLDPRLQRASVNVTLPYFSPARMDPAAWRRFTAFMHRNGLLKMATPDGAYTNRLLPASR